MGSLFKHGMHSVTLTLPALSAGSGSDSGVQYQFRPWPELSPVLIGRPTDPFDDTQYVVKEASFATDAVLTGQGTHFASIVLQHLNSLGAVVDDIRVDFSAVGVVTVANAPCNWAVASGVVVPGAGTGVLGNPTGHVLPFLLSEGDAIRFARLSNDGTGLATPSISTTFYIAQQGT